jgi:hypothetical protein
VSLSDIVKFDHVKGRFVYSPPENDNPFLWYVNRKPSIFATDPAFMTRGQSNASRSTAATQVIKTKREAGENPCQLYGLSKKSDERIRQTKEFSSSKTKGSEK